ncbi:MAG: HAD family hydrolase [Acidimicrobiales bacterium]
MLNEQNDKTQTGETPLIEAVLFDMGGVLIELGPLDELLGFEPGSGEDFWPRWLRSSAVRALETGKCEVDHFAVELVRELELSLTPADVVERFTAFPRGLYPGAVAMVDSLSDTVVTGLLSNTNQLHWEHQQDNEIVRAMFDHEYVSYRLGLLKPDREIFDHVVADLAVPAEQVLFIDDNQINVDGAIAAGLQAKVAKGPEEASAVLTALGLVKTQ